MSALASLDRFGEEDLVFISEDREHPLQNEWPLVFTCNSLAVKITGIFYDQKKFYYKKVRLRFLAMKATGKLQINLMAT